MRKFTDKAGKTHFLKQNTKGKWVQFFGSNESLINDDWYWCPLSYEDKQSFFKDFLKSL